LRTFGTGPVKEEVSEGERKFQKTENSGNGTPSCIRGDSHLIKTLNQGEENGSRNLKDPK